MIGFVLLVIHGYCEAFYGESFVKDVGALFGALLGEITLEGLGFCLVLTLKDIKRGRF